MIKYSYTIDGQHFYADYGDGVLQTISGEEYVLGELTNRLDEIEERVKKLESPPKEKK